MTSLLGRLVRLFLGSVPASGLELLNRESTHLGQRASMLMVSA